MWVYSVKGFVSIVVDRNPRHVGTVFLLVRARALEDLGPYVSMALENGIDPKECEVKILKEADYRYRVSVPMAVVRSVMIAAIETIDYTNFKGRALHRHPMRHDLLMDVWETTRKGFEALEKKTDAAKTKKAPKRIRRT